LNLYDVIVVGAGPAGSQVAYQLAGMGHRVVVMERKERLDEPVCCTGIISRECVNSFAIDEDVVLRWVNSASLFSPSGKQLRLWRQEPQAAIVDRSALNVALANRAQSRGAEYMLGSPVRAIAVDDGSVRIEAVRQGERLDFEARVAVIASGFGSRLTEDVGLGRVGDSVVGVQAEVEAIGIDEIEVYCGQEIAPAFFAWLVLTFPGKALVGLLSRHDPGFYLRKLLSSLLAEGKIASDKVGLRYGGISLRPLPRTCSDRLVVVGTAAGQVKPTTGGGIYFGLLCADIAAGSLHQALEANTLSAVDLAGYQHQWWGKLGSELKTGYRARKLYERLSDWQINKLFDIIRFSGIDQALCKTDDLTFDWHGRVVSRVPRLIWNGVFSRVI
jgi:digeranylgeranylglycerophospholipid reductase